MLTLMAALLSSNDIVTAPASAKEDRKVRIDQVQSGLVELQEQTWHLEQVPPP